MEDAERKLEHYGVKYWNKKFPDWPLYIPEVLVRLPKLGQRYVGGCDSRRVLASWLTRMLLKRISVHLRSISPHVILVVTVPMTRPRCMRSLSHRGLASSNPLAGTARPFCQALSPFSGRAWPARAPFFLQLLLCG